MLVSRGSEKIQGLRAIRMMKRRHREGAVGGVDEVENDVGEMLLKAC